MTDEDRKKIHCSESYGLLREREGGREGGRGEGGGGRERVKREREGGKVDRP